MNSHLYTNNNPNTTIQGTGFSNKNKAKYTISLTNKLVKEGKIDSVWQMRIIQTMYYRAFHHPHRNEKMEDAMKIFNNWLKKYKNKKKSKIKNMDIETNWLPYNLVHKFEKLADYYNISRGARGLEKPTTSDEGFVRIYEKINGNYNKLKKIPLRKDKPDGANWYQMRNVRVKAKSGQMKTMNIPLYHNSGKLKGLPTKMHTILIMWAYSPDEKNIKKLGNNLEKILKELN
jgi:hypothetical protein